METLYLLIPVSVILVFAIGVAFWFSLRGGQFEDMEGPAYRVVMDDDRAPSPAGAQASSGANEAPSVEKQREV